MNATRRFLYGPSLEEQRQKCDKLARSNGRKLDRETADLKTRQNKARSYILQADQRLQQRHPQAKQVAQELRVLARELLRLRQHEQRIITSKATLESVRMQVNEAFGMKRIASSVKIGVGIMQDMNKLVKLFELSGAMHELSQELMRAGMFDEMMEDMMPDETLEDETEGSTSDVEEVLQEILKEKMPPRIAQSTTNVLTCDNLQEDERLDIDQEDILAQKRRRLEALKN